MSASATLPFHAMALYSPIPTQKNVTNLVSFLPPLEQAGVQIAIDTLFAREYLAGTNRTCKLITPKFVWSCRWTDQRCSEPHVRRRRYAQAHEREHQKCGYDFHELYELL